MSTQNIDPKELRAGLRARQRAAAIHLFNPRISLIDLGWKVQDGELTDTLAVRFHVQKKPTGPTYEAFAARNPALVLPSSTDLGFPVDYIEASYNSQLIGSFPTADVIQRDGYFNPIQGGISISNEWDYGYSTLGGLVKDSTTGDPMILSAWHVLALSAYTRPGLRILQPGVGDGGTYQDTIARFTRHGMLQGIDAAVARLEGPRTNTNTELQIGPVAGVTEPVMDMRLTKSGRGSQITEGVVSGVEGERPIWYGGLQRKIRHLVHIVQPPEGGEVSRAGDSGSWWLEQKTNKVVALHIAGEDHPEYALAISMPRVLEALDVVIE